MSMPKLILPPWSLKKCKCKPSWSWPWWCTSVRDVGLWGAWVPGWPPLQVRACPKNKSQNELNRYQRMDFHGRNVSFGSQLYGSSVAWPIAHHGKKQWWTKVWASYLLDAKAASKELGSQYSPHGCAWVNRLLPLDPHLLKVPLLLNSVTG